MIKNNISNYLPRIEPESERNAMLKDFECIYCDTRFSVEMHANFIVICPCCKRTIFSECEYGYGPVTPCQIYLGEKIVGIVESKATNYYLNMRPDIFTLKETYLNALSEAENVVKKRLGIFCPIPTKKLQILTQKGRLCFYGDWFGKPYDRFRKIIHTDYDSEVPEIIFDSSERLLIYNPQNIVSTEHELKIEKAEKIKLMYTSYGTGTPKHSTIIYTAKCGDISKETKYGIEHLTVEEPFCAVYLGDEF